MISKNYAGCGRGGGRELEIVSDGRTNNGLRQR